ncbi:hypothetical protein Droror1_Dr00017597, partial [Drosera rotundifolia]
MFNRRPELLEASRPEWESCGCWSIPLVEGEGFELWSFVALNLVVGEGCAAKPGSELSCAENRDAAGLMCEDSWCSGGLVVELGRVWGLAVAVNNKPAL